MRNRHRGPSPVYLYLATTKLDLPILPQAGVIPAGTSAENSRRDQGSIRLLERRVRCELEFSGASSIDHRCEKGYGKPAQDLHITAADSCGHREAASSGPDAVILADRQGPRRILAGCRHRGVACRVLQVAVPDRRRLCGVDTVIGHVRRAARAVQLPSSSLFRGSRQDLQQAWLRGAENRRPGHCTSGPVCD